MSSLDYSKFITNIKKFKWCNLNLVTVATSSVKNYKPVDSLLQICVYLEYYTPGKAEKGTASVRKCSYTQPAQRGQVCDIDVKIWKDCVRDQHYNYHKSSPCIFLKLNKIYGWIPEYYNTTHDLPEDMPPSLKKRIADAKAEEVRESNGLRILFLKYFLRGTRCGSVAKGKTRRTSSI